jgi:hypothetical protein
VAMTTLARTAYMKKHYETLLRTFLKGRPSNSQTFEPEVVLESEADLALLQQLRQKPDLIPAFEQSVEAAWAFSKTKLVSEYGGPEQEEESIQQMLKMARAQYMKKFYSALLGTFLSSEANLAQDKITSQPRREYKRRRDAHSTNSQSKESVKRRSSVVPMAGALAGHAQNARSASGSMPSYALAGPGDQVSVAMPSPSKSPLVCSLRTALEIHQCKPSNSVDNSFEGILLHAYSKMRTFKTKDLRNQSQEKEGQVFAAVLAGGGGFLLNDAYDGMANLMSRKYLDLPSPPPGQYSMVRVTNNKLARLATKKQDIVGMTNKFAWCPESDVRHVRFVPGAHGPSNIDQRLFGTADEAAEVKMGFVTFRAKVASTTTPYLSLDRVQEHKDLKFYTSMGEEFLVTLTGRHLDRTVTANAVVLVCFAKRSHEHGAFWLRDEGHLEILTTGEAEQALESGESDDEPLET